MEFKLFENVQCIWKASENISETYLKFVKSIEEKYNVKLNTYWDLHDWTVKNIEEFWTEVWNFSNIKYSKTFDKVVDLSIPMSSAPKWFRGAKLNFAENILKYRDENTALVCIGEDGDERSYTFNELYEETKKFAAAFRNYGIKKGDRVACYMSNREEAIFAVLATLSIGAIWVGILPLLGAKAVLERLKLVNPRILITVDRFPFNKKEFDMLPNLEKIAEDLKTLEKTIIIPTKRNSIERNINKIPNSCFLEDFLKIGKSTNDMKENIIFEQVPFSHTLFINYTSGTTGAPKALLHDNGCLMSSMRDQIMHSSSERSAVTLALSPVGWASWNITILSLGRGERTILFDGEPYFLTPTYLWDIVDQYQVTNFFVTPGILDDIEKKGFIPTEKHSLASLKAIYAGASVVKPQNYDFVVNKIKPGILFSSVYGSTEVMGGLMSLNRSLPIYKGEVSCPCLGADIQCLDEAGNPLIGKVGELVITKPLPSLPLGLYGDTDGSTFKKTYFSKYTNKFTTGDLAAINPVTKGIIIYCRSDDVLKPYGCRFGSSEIYNVVNLLPEVHDSLCVSQYDKNKEERAVLFLKLRNGYSFNEELTNKVCRSIEKELTAEHIPGLILPVPDIPYNINGKKMEILVKKIINKMSYNPDVVRNKESLEHFLNVPEFEN